MSKKRKLKMKQQKVRRTRPKQNQVSQASTSKSKTILKTMWRVFLGFSAILGVVAILYPRPSVEPDNYLDPQNPLKTLFKITNETFLPLYDVQISCGIKKVICRDWPGVTGTSDYSSRLFNPEHVSQKLSYGDADTAYCPLGAFDLHSPVDYADFAVIVEFSPPIISWLRFERVFPFTTQKDVNGKLVLQHRPKDK